MGLLQTLYRFSGVNKNAQLWLRAINNVRNPRWCIKFSCLISVNIGRSLMCNRRIIAHLVFLPPSIILNHRESLQCLPDGSPQTKKHLVGVKGLTVTPKRSTLACRLRDLHQTQPGAGWRANPARHCCINTLPSPTSCRYYSIFQHILYVIYVRRPMIGI